MQALILGVDGYLGWPLAQHLAERGHQVAGADNYFRRRWVREAGSISATPVAPIEERLRAFAERCGAPLRFWEGDLREFSLLERIFQEFQPDAVVNLAECASAAYSMLDPQHAAFVQTNNLLTNLNVLYAVKQIQPSCHVVKAGSLAEYSFPKVPVPEGAFHVQYKNRQDCLPFPRQGGSWQELSSVHASGLVSLACQTWGLTATNLRQGTVFGAAAGDREEDERLRTRLDFDEAFGGAANRFCCQAVIDHPLTVYGGGRQKRAFLTLQDSVRGIACAVENPALPGDCRVLNHFSAILDLTELALRVRQAGREFGLHPDIWRFENPRIEPQHDFYDVEQQGLFEIGYWPRRSVDDELRLTIQSLLPHQERIRSRQQMFIPRIRWDGRREKVRPTRADAMVAAAS